MQVLLPRWSPDQKQILFSGFVPGKPGRNYMVSANGGVPQPVLPDELIDEEDPNWSPDGGLDRLLGLAEPSIFWICESTKYRSSRDQRVSSHLTGHPKDEYIVAMSGDHQALMLFDFKTQKWIELARVGVAYPNWSQEWKLHSLSIFRKRCSPLSSANQRPQVGEDRWP